MRGDDTIILDAAKASEVGWGLIMPHNCVGSSSTPMSELLNLVYITPQRVSLFCFFLFFILVGIFFHSCYLLTLPLSFLFLDICYFGREERNKQLEANYCALHGKL